MKTKLFLTALLSFIFCLLSSQVPQGFNYQAVARDAAGHSIVNTAMPVRMTIQSDSSLAGGTVFWKELHNSVITNNYGLINIVLGRGFKLSGIAPTFSAIDWSITPKFIMTEINYGGWLNMGITRLWSVPYSMIAGELGGPLKKLSVTGKTSVMDEALFEVKNKDGNTVFAVYNEGVRVYVADGVKGVKGGFAVGGFGTDKAGESQKYLVVSKDSTRIYIDSNPATKKTKGGFAVGGYDMTKGTSTNYMNVNTDASDIINNAQNRILWYPLQEKNAFLVGRILIPHPDSVGVNSVSAGFESRAKGQYSQAFGYQSIARGNYSTAIGRNAIAHKENSFAFGNDARALGSDSYAFGTGAIASGDKSFALGSSQKNDSTGATVHTIASSYGAFALGYGSVASNIGAFSIGVLDTAAGPGCLSMGYFNKSDNFFSTTFGIGNKASNYAATALGDHNKASGHTSFATGFTTVASGHLSSTFGDQTVAQSYGSMAIGRYNVISGTSTIWYSWDPVFAVGNGTSNSSRSNAFTVYKSGNADLGGRLNLNNYISLNRGSTGVAMYVNNDEALWYDGTTYSWGFGGTYNVFADHVSIGTTGTNSTYELYVVGNGLATGSFYSTSDLRWKNNITNLENVLDKVIRLNGVNFSWKKDEFPDLGFDSGTQIGLIAQEVEKIFPELVRTDGKGYKGVSYDKLSVILLEGIKEQQKQIESQNDRISELERLIREMQTKIAEPDHQ